MLVFEGPDNSGKSTLADFIHKEYGLPRYSAGPAPGSQKELINCLHYQDGLLDSPVIFDRVTCISQQVYTGGDAMLDTYLRRMAERAVIVYCRPPDRTLMDFSTHRIKAYDTEESLRKIVDHQHEYIEKYDRLMDSIPHVRYDWTDEGHDKEGFARCLMWALDDTEVRRKLYGQLV